MAIGAQAHIVVSSVIGDIFFCASPILISPFMVLQGIVMQVLSPRRD